MTRDARRLTVSKNKDSISDNCSRDTNLHAGGETQRKNTGGIINGENDR